jgi:hypothetical protein
MARDAAFQAIAMIPEVACRLLITLLQFFFGGHKMKTPTSLLVVGVAGCFYSALLQAVLVSTATAADSSTSLSLLQQPAVTTVVAKAQGSGTAPIMANPVALALGAQKGQTAVGTLALRKSGTDQHSYYLSTNQSWVWMNPPYGSTQTISSETDQLVITAQTAGLPVGTHSAVVYIVDSGPNNFTNVLRIPLTLTVTAAPATAAPPPPPASPPPATPPPPPVVVPPPPVVLVPPPPTAPPPAPPVVSTSGIAASPVALALKAQSGQTAVGTLALHKSGTDQHSYYLSTNQSWVWMNPPYGSTQTISSETDQLVITAQTAGLPAGTHSAVVYIVDSGPNNFTNMLRIPLTLTVTAAPATAAPPPPPASPPPATPPPPPVVVPPPPPPPPPATTPPPATPSTGTTPIQVSPAALALTSQNATGTLTLSKSGTDRHTYHLSTNQSWVWMNPPYGSTQTISSEMDQLVIMAQTAGLPAGTHSAVVYIVDSGPNNFSNTLRIPVTITIAANQTASPSPPAASTQPGAGSPPPPPPSPTSPPPIASAPPSPPHTPTMSHATVSWNANTEKDLAGYRVYVGTRSGVYTFAGPFEVTNGTSFTVPNLPIGTTYFFAVTAFDKAGNESTKSNEVSKSLF